MYLGKRCHYAKECPVYQGQVTDIDTPLFIVKNVFCNRGIKGWSNCKRYRLLEQNLKVEISTTPYEEK